MCLILEAKFRDDPLPKVINNWFEKLWSIGGATEIKHFGTIFVLLLLNCEVSKTKSHLQNHTPKNTRTSLNSCYHCYNCLLFLAEGDHDLKATEKIT